MNLMPTFFGSLINLMPTFFNALIVVVGLIAGYFLPFLIAAIRSHHQSGWIFLLTALGLITGGVTWLVALLWAFMPVPRDYPLANRREREWW